MGITKTTNGSGELLFRNPITGIAGCCARAASGHAATAPPRRVMNSRRLIQAFYSIPTPTVFLR